jgi:hypothetical protein
MNTEENNRYEKNPENSFERTEDLNAASEEFYDIEEVKQNNDEIAERGYTIRNGNDPDNPNPDQGQITNDDDFITNGEDDLDDLSDDFHAEDDLDHVDDDIPLQDEFDNPSDDFNETEEDADLESLDEDFGEQDFEEVPLEEDTQENSEDNDPGRF